METQKLIVNKNLFVVNVVMTGVGGQGVLVASDILAQVALAANFDVKKSEVHGMAQRGGSVISQVRYGAKIYSPLIDPGTADVIVAFEKLEALRYLDLLKPGGAVIINDQQITPLTVFFADIPYPQDVEKICRRKAGQVAIFDGVQIAEKLGNQRVLNTVMLGALSNLLEFDEADWLNAIAQRVPPKTVAMNRDGFAAGKRFLFKSDSPAF